MAANSEFMPRRPSNLPASAVLAFFPCDAAVNAVYSSQKAVAEAAAGALTPRSLPPKKKPTTPSVRLAPGVWAGERIQLVSPKKMARDVPHHEVLTDQTENGLSHLQQRQGSNGPMPQSRIEASSEGVLRRGQIPRTFLITDKAWSARVDKLNRSLARTHPGWPVLFFDDDMAEEFVKHHYPNMPYAKVLHQFRIPAHRADFFRYAALHAIGGYYVDADNRPVVNLKAVTRGLDFVTALDSRSGLIHNGFIAARPESGITLRLLRDTAEKVRQSSLARYCYFVRSGLSVIASAIHLRPGQVRADTLYTAEGYNGSRRERVLFVSHDTRPTSHPNHTRAALWACGLNQRRATPAPAAEPRMNQCECMMHVAVHPSNYAELEEDGRLHAVKGTHGISHQ